ncbi:2254_t:CDS:2, partial [Funneliformis mosseae]
RRIERIEKELGYYARNNHLSSLAKHWIRNEILSLGGLLLNLFPNSKYGVRLRANATTQFTWLRVRLEMDYYTCENVDRNQVTKQILKCDLFRPISSVKLHNESILNNTIEGSMKILAYWIDETIRMGLKGILCLYHYFFKFEEKLRLLQL